MQKSIRKKIRYDKIVNCTIFIFFIYQLNGCSKKNTNNGMKNKSIAINVGKNSSRILDVKDDYIKEVFKNPDEWDKNLKEINSLKPEIIKSALDSIIKDMSKKRTKLNGDTIYHYCLRKNYKNIITALKKSGLRTNIKSSYGLDAMQAAFGSNNQEIIKIMLSDNYDNQLSSLDDKTLNECYEMVNENYSIIQLLQPIIHPSLIIAQDGCLVKILLKNGQVFSIPGDAKQIWKSLYQLKHGQSIDPDVLTYFATPTHHYISLNCVDCDNGKYHKEHYGFYPQGMLFRKYQHTNKNEEESDSLNNNKNSQNPLLNPDDNITNSINNKYQLNISNNTCSLDDNISKKGDNLSLIELIPNKDQKIENNKYQLNISNNTYSLDGNISKKGDNLSLIELIPNKEQKIENNKYQLNISNNTCGLNDNISNKRNNLSLIKFEPNKDKKIKNDKHQLNISNNTYGLNDNISTKGNNLGLVKFEPNQKKNTKYKSSNYSNFKKNKYSRIFTLIQNLFNNNKLFFFNYLNKFIRTKNKNILSINSKEFNNIMIDEINQNIDMLSLTLSEFDNFTNQSLNNNFILDNKETIDAYKLCDNTTENNNLNNKNRAFKTKNNDSYNKTLKFIYSQLSYLKRMLLNSKSLISSEMEYQKKQRLLLEEEYMEKQKKIEKKSNTIKEEPSKELNESSIDISDEKEETNLFSNINMATQAKYNEFKNEFNELLFMLSKSSELVGVTLHTIKNTPSYIKSTINYLNDKRRDLRPFIAMTGDQLGNVGNETFYRQKSINNNHNRIKFYIDPTQSKKALEYIRTTKKSCSKVSESCKYNLLGRNCVDFCAEVFKYSTDIDDIDPKVFISDSQFDYGYMSSLENIMGNNANFYAYFKSRGYSGFDRALNLNTKKESNLLSINHNSNNTDIFHKDLSNSFKVMSYGENSQIDNLFPVLVLLSLTTIKIGILKGNLLLRLLLIIAVIINHTS